MKGIFSDHKLPYFAAKGHIVGYQLFYFESTDLTPETRWFLWQWERRIGLHKPFDGTVRNLLGHLNISVRQGQKTLLEMKENGIVEALPMIKKVGRPSYRYCIAKTLLETLTNLPNEAPLLSNFMEHISEYEPPVFGDTGNEKDQDTANSVFLSLHNKTTLIDTSPFFHRTSDENEKIIKLPLSIRQPNLHYSHQRKEKLTWTNRWLLLVMLARSEVPGIVTDLSNATLQRLTGMTANQLASQIRKLKTLGIILQHQTGQAGRVLGERMTSIYQLDLSHSLLGCPESEALRIYFPIANDNTFTDRSCGLIDALMVYSISIQYQEILNKRLERLRTQYFVEKKLPTSNFLKLESKLDKEIRKSQEVFSYAENLLPKVNHLLSTINNFTKNCNVQQMDWLLINVHVQAMRILSTQWKYLENNKPLPNRPDIKEKPEAALHYELAYKLAMDLHLLLKKVTEKQQKEDFKFELLNFTLTISNGAKNDRISNLILRCFTMNDSLIAPLNDCKIRGSFINFNMRNYWQIHLKKIISAQST